MKLEITKEKVLEAASKCSQAKETLKTLFPEVFEDNKYFDFSKAKGKGVKTPDGFSTDNLSCTNIIAVRDGGEFKNKAFYLYNSYNWEIKRDSDGILCLIPTKKS